MAMKMSSSVVFVALVLVVAVALTAPMAEAQLGSGLGGLSGIIGGLINPITSLIQIQGTVLCAVNATLGANPISSVFPNAGVELHCGGITVASTTTNSSGAFSITLNPINVAVSALTQICMVAVTTPLATCNATLPSVGSLVSPLQAAGTSVLGGLLQITNLVPTAFRLVPTAVGGLA